MSQVDAMLAALRPFAAIAHADMEQFPDRKGVFGSNELRFVLGDFRRANMLVEQYDQGQRPEEQRLRAALAVFAPVADHYLPEHRDTKKVFGAIGDAGGGYLVVGDFRRAQQLSSVPAPRTPGPR